MKQLLIIALYLTMAVVLSLLITATVIMVIGVFDTDLAVHYRVLCGYMLFWVIQSMVQSWKAYWVKYESLEALRAELEKAKDVAELREVFAEAWRHVSTMPMLEKRDILKTTIGHVNLVAHKLHLKTFRKPSNGSSWSGFLSDASNRLEQIASLREFTQELQAANKSL